MAEYDKIESRPIPAFYCCYLLRSKNRKSYYIGSTPNPARRLGQHNGSSKGGAKRTAMQGKRPWEMTCIVYGFPSKFAALQFEWAWQNTHATRHIQRDVRDARLEELRKGKNNISSARRRRPPMSLEARLKNLHHLLGVESFHRWPLHVRFFAADVFTQWERHAAKLTARLRSTILVQLTPTAFPKLASDVMKELGTYFIPEPIRAIPVAYEDCKAYVEKSRHVFQASQRLTCSVCHGEVDVQSSLLLLCPVDRCRSISHLSCLSNKFLADQTVHDTFIPIEGTCLDCKTQVQWSTMAKELSLRMHGKDEINALFREKHKYKPDKVSEADTVDLLSENEDEDLDEMWLQDVDDEEDK